MSSGKDWYNRLYQKNNYFGYRQSIYGPYIKGLVSRARVSKGSTILDVGCGQGFFCYLLHKCGMKVYGMDISESGIYSARRTYGLLGIEFVVADFHAFPFQAPFDCVFTRSFSLYNTDDFPWDRSVTDRLLNHVKQGGIFIFVYNTNLDASKKNMTWRYHTLKQVQQHFSVYKNVETFFAVKVDTLLIGKYAFNFLSTGINTVLSRSFSLGGDLVCIVRK
jgi:SAM-dependent methyltransferase